MEVDTLTLCDEAEESGWGDYDSTTPAELGQDPESNGSEDSPAQWGEGEAECVEENVRDEQEQEGSFFYPILNYSY